VSQYKNDEVISITLFSYQLRPPMRILCINGQHLSSSQGDINISVHPEDSKFFNRGHEFMN